MFLECKQLALYFDLIKILSYVHILQPRVMILGPVVGYTVLCPGVADRETLKSDDKVWKLLELH